MGHPDAPVASHRDAPTSPAGRRRRCACRRSRTAGCGIGPTGSSPRSRWRSGSHGAGSATPSRSRSSMRTPGPRLRARGRVLPHRGHRSTARDDLAEVRYCLGPDAEQEYNVVTVATRRPVDLEGRTPRVRRAASSCGVCGKATLDQLEVDCAPLGAGPGRRDARRCSTCPTGCATAQTVFDATGGLHAAGLVRADGDAATSCGRTSAGTTRSTSSSVTRCSPARCRSPTRSWSCRVGLSFEIVQKAARGGHPDRRSRCRRRRASRSRPRSASSMTLVGFVRDGARQRLHRTPSASTRTR